MLLILKNLFKNEITRWVLVIISIPVVYFALSYIQTFDSSESPIYLIGIMFSLGMTFLYSLKIISSKYLLKSDAISINLLIFFISFFVVLTLLPFISLESILGVSDNFWWVFVVSSMFYYFGKYFNIKAIDHGEISSVVLLHSVTPIVIGIFSFFILKELPTWGGLIGALVILVAIYFLKLEKTHTHFLDPIKSLFQDKATIYIVISIFAFAVTTNMDKIGSQLSSAYEWVFLSNIFLLLVTAPSCLKQIKQNETKITDIRAIYFVALLAVFQLVFQMIAILNILVVYVVTIKVASIIITIVIGGIFFKEENLKKKFLLGLLVVLGVVLISLLG